MDHDPFNILNLICYLLRMFISMFRILSCNFIFLWYPCMVLVSWYHWYHEMTLEVSSLLLFFVRIEGLALILLWKFGRIHQWSYLFWTFICRMIFLIKFDSIFFTSKQCIQIFCFCMIQFWKVVCFRNLSIFILCCPVCCHIIVHGIRKMQKKYFCVSALSVYLLSHFWFYLRSVFFFLNESS